MHHPQSLAQGRVAKEINHLEVAEATDGAAAAVAAAAGAGPHCGVSLRLI